jgi:hypothetical protein
MSQLKTVVDPFGEVNVYAASSGRKRVVATILMEPRKEGAQTGIALDGSGSMAKLYGVDDGSRIVSPLFGGAKKLNNEVSPVAQKICAYLARKIDADGGTTCIYWSVGPGGSEVEVVGDLRAEQAERHLFGPPREFGTGTQLLPAVRYFVERFADAPWGFYVFITDGELHDLDEVLDYSKRLARDVAARRHNPVKFVLIGLGTQVNEAQMAELDDLDSGVDVDLWDHKLAAEMRRLEEIFAEVVDRNARVADHGKIFDSQGGLIKDYALGGLPAFLEFEVPGDAQYFTLEVNGQRIQQPLYDGVALPAGSSDTKSYVSTPVSTPTATPVSKPAHDPAGPTDIEDVTDADNEWKSLPLEFGPEGEKHTDIDLEMGKD